MPYIARGGGEDKESRGRAAIPPGLALLRRNLRRSAALTGFCLAKAAAVGTIPPRTVPFHLSPRAGRGRMHRRQVYAACVYLAAYAFG